ncbi:hypothetical protein JW756_02290 [Candidatus Woesearchaeota archaeon]|nr:hypothetical protein [Candidatus Woesearchaeota archaeon]
MAEEKNYFLPLISIVAIVAIVGLVMMFMFKGSEPPTKVIGVPIESGSATPENELTEEQITLINEDLGEQNLGGKAVDWKTYCKIYMQRAVYYVGQINGCSGSDCARYDQLAAAYMVAIRMHCAGVNA